MRGQDVFGQGMFGQDGGKPDVGDQDVGPPAGSITQLLARAVARAPRSVFLRTTAGAVTYGDFARRVATAAGGLAALGVDRDVPVALVMGTSIEQVVVWFALARLRAIHAPLNPALVGAGLRHALAVADAGIVVADEASLGSLLGALAGDPAAAARVHTLVVATGHGAEGPPAEPDSTATGMLGGDGAGDAPLGHLRTLDLGTVLDHPDPAPAVAGDDLATATLLFTSGSTGPSKACALSHRHLARQGQLHAGAFGLSSHDVLYCPFPLFHIDAATLTVAAALAVGGTAALGARFSASRFWSEVRAFDATVFNFMGATLTILWKQDPDPRDRDHRVRLAWGVPMPTWRAEWEERFGFPLFQVYGLTDAGVPVHDPIDGTRREGACGRVLDEYEVRIDPEPGAATDPVVGEILVRGREPGLTMNGYHGMPEATARTITSDGWVRTGDLGSLEDGWLTFHGRRSDSIRRRGENISAQEVEEVVASHPDVREVAAFGVPSELTEEDVKVSVVLRPGADLEPSALHAHCVAHMAAFMAPRWIEFVDELPRTPTQKVEKGRLRDAGVTAASWDAEAHRGDH